MHLRNVEIFCDVAARRSFSQAAKAHQLSQSAASQAVNSLEKRLGIRLIDRTKRPLELTSAGNLYYKGCREMLAAFHKVEDRVRELDDRITGRVRVAAIYSVGLLIMNTYTRRFQELYPEVELHIDYAHPDEVYERVRSGKADFGIVSFPREGGEFSAIPWQEQEMLLVVPANHRLAGREVVAIAEIGGEDYVSFTRELKIRKNVDRWLKHAGVSVNIVHEFDNIENIKRAVEIGTGVALLPRETIRRETQIGSLAAVRIEDLDCFRPLGLVHKRHRNLSAAANRFVELLHEAPETFHQHGDEQLSHEATRSPVSDTRRSRIDRPRAVSEPKL